MNTQSAVAIRLREICKQKGITPNKLANEAGVPQSTLKSILGGESQNPGIVTLKKLCDGVDVKLPDFFDAPIFWSLEQEIK